MLTQIVLSRSLELGQLTFILRVVVQVLSYAGVTLLSLILVAHAPRVTTVETHDIINRLVGSATMTWSTLRWLIGCSKRSQRPPFHVILVICFAISYAAFVALSDIGILGLESCEVGGPPTYLRPASIASNDTASALIINNIVNGTSPSQIGVHRCDLAEVDSADPYTFNCILNARTSTLADADFWKGLNATDTDAMMPRRLQRFGKGAVDPNSQYSFMNSSFYQLGPSNTRLNVASAKNGLALFPHSQGLLVVGGVPNLGPRQDLSLGSVLAMNVDFGCMSTGIYSLDDGPQGFTHDLFENDDQWRLFSGPDYMHDLLSSYVDTLRSLLQPMFNATPPSNYDLSPGLSATPSPLFTETAYPPIGHVRSWTTPDSMGEDPLNMLQECSKSLRTIAGGDISSNEAGSSCGFMGVGGAFEDGAGRFSRMLCATATQLSIASLEVSTDTFGIPSVASIIRAPSQLNHIRFNLSGGFNSTYDRYTLYPAPNSSDSHFILSNHAQEVNPGTEIGSGSVGSLLPRIGNVVLDPDGQFTTLLQYSGISLLNNSLDQFELTPDVITRWAGEVAGSVVQESISFNGWAALDQNPIAVISRGGRFAICYEPIYALGFLPLVISALILVVWSLFMLYKSTLPAADSFKASYGGLGPYKSAICLEAMTGDTLLVWENTPQPSLQVLPKGAPILGDRNSSALDAIRSGSPYTTYRFTPLDSDSSDHQD